MNKRLEKILIVMACAVGLLINDCLVIVMAVAIAGSSTVSAAKPSAMYDLQGTLTAAPTIEIVSTATAVVPTETYIPTTAPTSTPVPTYTPEPTADVSDAKYKMDVATQLMIIQPNLLAVVDLSQQASDDYRVINTKSWQNQFFGAIDEMIAASKALTEVSTPAKFEHVQFWLNKLYPELVDMKADLRKGIDNFDPEYIRRGSEHMNNVATYVTNSTTELDKVQ